MVPLQNNPQNLDGSRFLQLLWKGKAHLITEKDKTVLDMGPFGGFNTDDQL